jgi:large repetitive protein
MTVASVANAVARSRSEVTAYQDKDVQEIANDLALSDYEARLIGNLGTPITVPGAPTAPVATRVSNTKVSVAFVPPVNDGGDRIEAYEVTSTPAGFDAAGAGSPVVVDGAFAKGIAYTFKVTAANSEGFSAASAASAAVTPNP